MATLLLVAEARLQNTTNFHGPPPPDDFQPTPLQPISLINIDLPTQEKANTAFKWLAAKVPTPKAVFWSFFGFSSLRLIFRFGNIWSKIWSVHKSTSDTSTFYLQLVELLKEFLMGKTA
ncbi:hypothetical protein IFR05_012988 [Cadophora sp. M221]|nr:hypothetical protein IFR05_012988 [Cadophora sp. M221]